MSRPLALAMAVAVGVGACRGPARYVGYEDLVETRGTAALEERGLSGRVAVAPFWPGGALVRGPAPDEARAAAARVGVLVGDALRGRGFEVVPSGEMADALGMPDYAVGALDPGPVAWVAHRRFGAGEVLLGEVLRWRERRGGAAGSTSPAGVAFRVTLYTAPGGDPLWTARFDETQTALLDNVVHASRYPGGGTRWLTADEMARWGADAVAAAVPEEARAVGARTPER